MSGTVLVGLSVPTAISEMSGGTALSVTRGESTLVETERDRVVLVTRGVPGPPGGDGPPGPAGGAAFVRRAGEPLSALVVVHEDETGQVFRLDPDDKTHIDMLAGLTITSASLGQDITVQRSGPLDAAGLGLVPGRVWLGAGGQLTQAAPSAGFDLLVGHAVAGGRMYLTFDDAINLED